MVNFHVVKVAAHWAVEPLLDVASSVKRDERRITFSVYHYWRFLMFMRALVKAVFSRWPRD